MREILPPVCFLLAFALLVTGFALLAIGPPEESVELHRARAAGDDQFTEQLEADFENQQRTRLVLLGSTFAGSVAMVVVGFRAMNRR